HAIRGIELGHVAAGKEVAQSGFAAERTREHVSEWRGGVSRVATVAGVQREFMAQLAGHCSGGLRTIPEEVASGHRRIAAEERFALELQRNDMLSGQNLGGIGQR